MDTELRQLAISYFKTDSIHSCLLKGDGSDRNIYLLQPEIKTGKQLVGVYHQNLKENSDFIYITGKMAEIGIPVPKVYRISDSGNSYLLQYLGEDNLAECLFRWHQKGLNSRILQSYKRVLCYLFKIQQDLTPRLNDFLASRVMSGSDFKKDLDYFARDFISRFDYIGFFTKEVQQELEKALLNKLSEYKPQYFVYRDFQSRNIMWYQDQPWFIDYQSAFLGSAFYDLASLLFASKSYLNQQFREELLEYFFELSGYGNNYTHFLEQFYQFVLIRRLRSLGSYGFLSMEKGKTSFLSGIGPTLKELIDLLSGVESLNCLPKTLGMLVQISTKWENSRYSEIR